MEVIKLTLGLTDSISHVGNSTAEMMFRTKEKDLALMSDRAWKNFGARPFLGESSDVSRFQETKDNYP
jgi:apoptosis-inducing factor 2